jgi:hypothetical protein
MSVCCDCCVLSGRDFCDGLITQPEESYQVCVCVCVSVCNPESSTMRILWAIGRLSLHG